MKIFCKFPTVNISKLNFCLIICMAKNYILDNFKIFSIFILFCTPAKYCPILTNHTSMESLFIQLSDININYKCFKITIMTGFVVQGHTQCWGKLLLKVTHYNIALLPKKVTNYIT